jgi:exonuclease III
MPVLTLATININGFTAPTRVGMFTNFLRRHDIDIPFVQEVTNTEVLHIRGHETQKNGASIRGTAILAKHGLHLENIASLPSERAIATVYQGNHLINIYAPSGTTMRKDREQFFNADLPFLFRTDIKHMILGGDFNYVLHPADVSAHFHPAGLLQRWSAVSNYGTHGTKTPPYPHTCISHLMEPPD